MQIILNQVYKTISYDPTRSFWLVRWTKNTELMDDKEFQEIMLLYRSITEEYNPDFVLIDLREFHFTVAPEMQVWINETINIPLEKNFPVKRVAFLCNASFFIQLSLEQTIDDSPAHKDNKTRFFELETEAEKWLFENS